MEKKNLAFGRIPSYRKYELFMERYRSAADDFITPYLEANADAPSYSLLDVGAGEGYLKFFLDNPKIKFDGIELQPDRIEICKSMGYRIDEVDIENSPLPYADQTYDIVVASHVIEHLYDPTLAISEIYRVLKPNGICVIGVPMHMTWVAKLMQLKEKIKPNERFGHHQFYSMNSLREALREFEIMDIRGFRLISSRKRFNWEDKEGFWKFNTWWGKKFPNLTPEVNVVMRRPTRLLS